MKLVPNRMPGEGPQPVYDGNRIHDVSDLTISELEIRRRELMASLGLSSPGSPVRGPIEAHLAAIDAELNQRPDKM